MIRILVPVDFSTTSSNALQYAIQLFGMKALEITLLHAFSSNPTIMSMKNIDRVILKDSKQSMERLLKKFQKGFPNVNFKTKILSDHAVSCITSLGNSGEYNYIIMGTKGASGLKEVFLGSVAGGVISKTSAPVLVVPETHLFHDLDEIVLALGDTILSGEKVIQPLRELAQLQKSRIKVLHISESDTDTIEQSLEAIKDLNPSIEYAFGTGDTNQDLHDYIRENDSKLICLIRGHKGFFNRLFKESVTLKQTFESSVPLLILHDLN
ncbi:universal stress protein [Lutimonas sp.]|uniref:universal stress protein n=1 Tax=Lutimonas sp. TaxID=1872403 RepID=UPI003D9B96C6